MRPPYNNIASFNIMARFNSDKRHDIVVQLSNQIWFPKWPFFDVETHVDLILNPIANQLRNRK